MAEIKYFSEARFYLYVNIMAIFDHHSNITATALLLDLFHLPLTLLFVRQRHLLWNLLKRDDVSSNWNVPFSSATKYCIFCPEIFFTLTNSVYPVVGEPEIQKLGKSGRKVAEF